MPRDKNESKQSKGSDQQAGKQATAEDADLKRREYRDKQGDVHHHTHTSREYQKNS